MKTKNYLLKQIVNFIFNKRIYHKLKLYKIIADFKLGKPYEISSILSFLSKDSDIILDVGANMGQFACRFSKIVGPHGRVYCFEPVSFNYEALLTMKKALKMSNTDIYNYAISDNDNKGVIKIPEFNNGLVIGTQSTLLKLDENVKFKEEEVNIRTIDSLIEELKIERVDFIKSDTEGNEINVLMGGYKAIKTHLPIMYLEVNYRNNGLDDFYKLGYKPYHLIRKNSIQEIIDKQAGDLILIHKDKALKILEAFRFHSKD